MDARCRPKGHPKKALRVVIYKLIRITGLKSFSEIPEATYDVNPPTRGGGDQNYFYLHMNLLNY